MSGDKNRKKRKAPAPFTVPELLVFLLMTAAMVGLVKWGETAKTGGEDIAHIDTSKASDTEIMIGVDEIEKFFECGDGAVGTGKLYYNAQNVTPVFCYLQKQYALYSAALGGLKNQWEPEIGAPGIMMYEPFRYFVFNSQGIRYMDDHERSAAAYETFSIVRDSSGEVDYGYYGRLLADHSSLSLRDFWSVIQLIKDNTLIGFKDGVSWFGKIEADAFSVYRYMNGETECLLRQASAVSGPMAVVENRILLMISFQGNDKLLLYDLIDRKGMQVFTNDGKSITAWNYMLEDGKIYLVIGADHYVGSGFITPEDVMNVDYSYTLISSTKTTCPESICIHRTSTGELMMYFTDGKNISTMKASGR